MAQEDENFISKDVVRDEINKAIRFYGLSNNTNDFEKYSNRGAIGALLNLKTTLSIEMTYGEHSYFNHQMSPDDFISYLKYNKI
jgi:hypothetical protein